MGRWRQCASRRRRGRSSTSTTSTWWRTRGFGVVGLRTVDRGAGEAAVGGDAREAKTARAETGQETVAALISGYNRFRLAGRRREEPPRRVVTVDDVVDLSCRPARGRSAPEDVRSLQADPAWKSRKDRHDYQQRGEHDHDDRGPRDPVERLRIDVPHQLPVVDRTGEGNNNCWSQRHRREAC